MRLAPVLAVTLAVLAAGCRERHTGLAPGHSVVEELRAHSATAAALPAGERRIPVDGGSIWVKVRGGGDATPVILLHGGPGITSQYLRPLEALSDERPVVRYDQLGSGKSDGLNDIYKMTIPFYVAELESLRSALGYRRVHLVGHSWGAILALEYTRAHPDHVESLTLASATLDMPAWGRSVQRMIGTLSDSAQRAIARHDAGNGRVAAPGYGAAAAEFYAKYVWRHPVAVDLDSMIAGANARLGMQMRGANQFAPGGTLERYDGTDYLRKVKVPTLFVVGQFDEADPVNVRRFAALTPGGKYVEIPGAAHMLTWDNPDATVMAVRMFLRSADSTMAKRRRRLL